MANNGRQWHDALPKIGFPTLFNRNVNSNSQGLKGDFADDFDSAVWSDPLRTLEPRRIKEVPREEGRVPPERVENTEDSNRTNSLAKPPEDPKEKEGEALSSPNRKKKNSAVVASFVIAAFVVTAVVVAVVVALSIKKKPEGEASEAG